MKLNLKKLVLFVPLALILAMLPVQKGLCQACATPLQVCGGTDHKKCCSPVEGKEYSCIGTDTNEVDTEKSTDIGSCEEKSEESK